jgi:hypothetical protein
VQECIAYNNALELGWKSPRPTPHDEDQVQGSPAEDQIGISPRYPQH